MLNPGNYATVPSLQNGSNHANKIGMRQLCTAVPGLFLLSESRSRHPTSQSEDRKTTTGQVQVDVPCYSPTGSYIDNSAAGIHLPVLGVRLP